MKIKSDGISNSKIILIGEHSVVYGKPAIALPLKKIKVRATIQKNIANYNEIKSDYYNGSLKNMPSTMNGIKYLIYYLKKQLNIINPIKININSEIPVERGMGSSAAISIAIIRSFFNYTKTYLSKNNLLKISNISEKEFHKNPSGLDAAACSSNNPIWMIKNKEFKNISISLNGYLVIADTGIKSKTSEAVKNVKIQLIKNSKFSHKLIEELGNLAYEAKNALKNNDIYTLGNIFNATQDRLYNLNVSCNELDKLINISLKNGSIGSKLTGSGKGGCLICLTTSKKNAEHLSKVLLTNGATNTWIECLIRKDI